MVDAASESDIGLNRLGSSPLLLLPDEVEAVEDEEAVVTSELVEDASCSGNNGGVYT